MDTNTPTSVNDVIAIAGGAETVLSALGRSTHSLKKWRQTGIPPRHYSALVRMSGGSLSWELLDTVSEQAKAAWEAREAGA